MENKNLINLDRLYEEVRKTRMTGSELAKKTKLGKSFVYDLLNKRFVNPSMEKFQRLADFFGVSMDFLVGKTDIRNCEGLIPLNKLNHNGHLEPSGIYIEQNSMLNISDLSKVRIFQVSANIRKASLKTGDLVIIYMIDGFYDEGLYLVELYGEDAIIHIESHEGTEYLMRAEVTCKVGSDIYNGLPLCNVRVNKEHLVIKGKILKKISDV